MKNHLQLSVAQRVRKCSTKPCGPHSEPAQLQTSSEPAQGCQIVFVFAYQKSQFGYMYFWGPWNRKWWYIFWPSGLFFSLVVNFTAIWYCLWSFDISFTSWFVVPKDLATLKPANDEISNSWQVGFVSLTIRLAVSSTVVILFPPGTKPATAAFTTTTVAFWKARVFYKAD
jgi:hypothetical protein